MKITKRQLRRIIREEKARLLREQSGEFLIPDVGEGFRTWTFDVSLRGSGDSVEEAWEDAVNAFATDPGEPDPRSTHIDDDY